MNPLEEVVKFGVGFAAAYPLTYIFEKYPLYEGQNPLTDTAFLSVGSGVIELMRDIPEPSYWLGVTVGSAARSVPTYLKIRAKEKAKTAKEYFLGNLSETEF